MAKLTNEEIINALKEMTILEVNDLVKAVEEAFGVTAVAAAAAPVAAAHEEEAAAPTDVTVYLKSVGNSKIPVIKAVQAITGATLLDSKKLCEALPAAVKEHISPAVAEDIKKQLVDAGAEVEIK